jgi:hypothetical protein
MGVLLGEVCEELYCLGVRTSDLFCFALSVRLYEASRFETIDEFSSFEAELPAYSLVLPTLAGSPALLEAGGSASKPLTTPPRRERAGSQL